MAKRRDRYTITGSMAANGQSLQGITLIDHGPCGFAGYTSTKDGGKLLKGDLYLRKFKFEDAKVAKSLGLPKSLTEFHFSTTDISIFLTKQEEINL